MTIKEKTRILELREHGMNYGDIADELGVSESTIKSFFRRKNQGSGRGKDTVPATCKNCGQRITSLPGHKMKQFCSDSCRLTWWNLHQDQVNRKAVYSFTCANCGKPFEAYGNKQRKYCSRDCYISGRFTKEVSANG